MSLKQNQSGDGKWHFRVSESHPSTAIIEAMAFVRNRDPTDIEPLADVIDPDALDRLLSRIDSVTISFEWGHYDVQAFASGEIIIAEDDDSS